MKKLLVLLTLMVGLFGFTAGASAQVCTSCGGTDIRNVPCVDEQGACEAFDYDLNSWPSDGYCASSKDKYRAIFDICECVDPNDKFVLGTSISIRMTILVNGASGANGAYWSAFTAAPLAFGAAAT